jgi:U4/U6 small nuclear ribonucleoprotein PRP31
LEADSRGELKGMENLSQKEVALKLIVQTNEYLKHIENDILIVHKELRDLYAEKFPELESIVLNPIDYARSVKVIGNSIGDISRLLELMNWLPNSTLMSVTVSFSASTGRQLNDKELGEVMKHCEDVVSLDHDKSRMLNYLESRMSLIAPNVSAINGSRVTANLIAAAGGIQELARIPACNI